tara:strand:+ start:59 stop:226 length:168 start_codon:yes stop_codon:yes gene_type:complete
VVAAVVLQMVVAAEAVQVVIENPTVRHQVVIPFLQEVQVPVHQHYPLQFKVIQLQ